uniref:Sulfotransferase domain-containing protein n=2 Tax=Emiliania huxleyi TaxID=2903 RepID=A0A7S3SKY6_EMIHU
MFSYPFSRSGNEIWGDLGRSGGEVFSYPFSQLGNETEDGTHYPRLADLQYLCELAGVRLKVVALWREPVDAIMSMNNRGLPKIWRRAGRTFKLHKQVELFLSQLDEMHSQLAALPPDSFRVVNYTHMLGNAKEYVRDLAAFLEVPEAHLDRAFTLSAKAKPKKRPRAPSSLPEGTWSDAVRQDFIQQRLAEAAASAKPPRCCDAWTRRLATQRLAQMPSPASSAKTRPRPPHWFTTWAQTAPPPLRAQAISFTHVVNPFDPGNSSEHRQAQRVTLASISHASALAAAQGIAVEVVCAVFPEDEAHVRREPLQCLLERINVSAATALPQFRHPVRLPFLNMLLYAGYSRGSGKYLIYTNIDIGLQPPFYLKLARQMQVMPGVPISSIREEFEHVEPAFGVEHAIARRGTGLQHPGHDCWAFPREWVPRLILGFTLVGVSMVATSLMQALHALSGCRMSLLSPKLTFHFVDGDSVVKHPSNQRARNDKIFTGLYTAWNCAQFARDRRDVLEVYPEYNQCWFSQQAEWNLYSYQCGTTIEHLPHEFKLLWQSAHNRTIRPAHGDCNLPSTCAKCRGRDGAAKPGADMMAPAPCAFCRCRGDLPTPPYITPPKQVARPATAGAAAGHRAAGNHSVRKGAPALSAVVR